MTADDRTRESMTSRRRASKRRRLRKIPTDLADAILADERMRRVHQWKAHYVSVARREKATVLEAPRWSIGASCLFIDDVDETLHDLHVQLFRRGPNTRSTAPEFRKLERTLRERLAPLGYRAVALDSANERPPFAVFAQRVATLSEARRERARLDRVLFS